MAQTTRSRSKSKPKHPQSLIRTNPRTGEKLGEIPANSPEEIRSIVEMARKVQPEWEALSAEGRAHHMKAVRARIYELMDEIVETVALDTGKPRAEALAHDVLTSVTALLYYERSAAKHLRPERPGKLAAPLLIGATGRVEYRPFGVVGAITPWNYPFYLSIQAVAGALFAGNTVVLKPSEVTPGVGEVLRKVFEPLPSGVLTVVQGAGEVGAAIVDAPVDKLSFIGSPLTGRKIMKAAAEHLTPVVMELGGKDTAIVCEDANLDVASSGVILQAFANSGQTCAALERVYVVDAVADEFIEMVVDKTKKLHHHVDEGDVGSLSFPNQLKIVESHIKDAVEKGATILTGGPEATPKNQKGALWYAPTVLTGVSEDMKMFAEETFGPTLPIIRVRDDDEAARRASDEAFSLTASVWTTNRQRAERIVKRLRTGSVMVNETGFIAAAASWAPWGGIGESGFGRLNGKEGLREFTFPVHVAHSLTPNQKRLWFYPYDEASRSVMRNVTEFLASSGVRQKMKHASGFMKDAMQVLRTRL